MFCDSAIPLDVVDIVFTNVTTGQSETLTGTTIVNQTCSGNNYITQTFDVGVPTNVGDEVKAVVNFETIDFRYTNIMFLKSTENTCDDIGGNAQFLNDTDDQYIVTGTFN